MDKKQQAAQKVYTCIQSCKTIAQLITCNRLILLFYNKYKSVAYFKEMQEFRLIKMNSLTKNKCDN